MKYASDVAKSIRFKIFNLKFTPVVVFYVVLRGVSYTNYAVQPSFITNRNITYLEIYILMIGGFL